MKYLQLVPFEKHLIQSSPNHFSPLYGALVKDGGERQLVCATIKKRITAAFPQLTVKTYSAEDSNGQEKFLADLNSFSFFSQEEMVQLTACELCSKEFVQQLQLSLQKISRKTFILLSGLSLPKNSPLFTVLEKQGVICEIGEGKLFEKEKAVADWLTWKAAQAKKTVEHPALQLLAKGVGGNLALGNAEWEKLCTYVHDKKEITAADVFAVCDLTTTDSAWHFIESFMSLQIKEALESALRALALDPSVLPLLRQMRYQAVLCLEVLTCGGHFELFSAKYPHVKGILFDKQVRTAKLWGEARLQQLIQKIDDAEFKAKDGMQTAETLITMFIAGI